MAIIGEPQDSTIYRTRKVYIYYGGIPFDTIPDLTFQRDFEMILHGDMDINRDGFTDVIITNDPDMYAGMFSIYLGSENGPSFNSEPDYELYGEIYGSHFGKYIIVKDINKDGCDDLIVPDPSDLIGGYGRVYIYYGGQNFDTEKDWFYESKNEWSFYGVEVACGDINNDGYNDLVVESVNELCNGCVGVPSLFFYKGSADSISKTPNVFFQGDTSYKIYRNFNIDNFNSDGKNCLLCSRRTADGEDDYIMNFKINNDFSELTIDSFLIDREGVFNDAEPPIINFMKVNNDSLFDFVISEDPIYKNTKTYLYISPIDFSVADTIAEFSIQDSSSWIEICDIMDLNSDGIDELIVNEGHNHGNKPYNTWRTYEIKIYSFDILKLSPIKKNTFNNTRPNQFILYQSYPNPFNPTTNIRFALPEAARVDISVYNLLGKRVWNYQSNNFKAGYHSVAWHGVDNTGSKVSSGLYIIRIRSKNQQATQKVMLMK